MEKDFMKLLKTYIDKMQELWEAGDCIDIHTLAEAITDMTKSSDMRYMLDGSFGLRKAAAELRTEEYKKKGKH